MNYLNTKDTMYNKPLIRNLILCILCTLFIIIACIINNHAVAAYHTEPEEQDYLIKHLVQQSDGLDFPQEDTIVYRDDSTKADLFSECYYTLLIDETDKKVLSAKNAHQRMYPASMTKMMTAIVVADQIESGAISLDDMVTVTQNYDLTSQDVAPFQLSIGDQIRIKDLLYGLMLESNNYYALMLAEYIAGDVPSFCEMMNQKANSIGATNTHYMNPHGLDDVNHYTTAYDMYLIVKEVHNHEILREIDDFDTYTYSYLDTNGVSVEMESTATNLFVTGDVSLPATFQIESWKTGTTSGAGNCLAMYLTKDNKTYIVVASSGKSREDLYNAIVKLLCLIS